MKTRNLMLAVVALLVLALPSCSTLKTSEAEQEEIVSQIQKDEGKNPVQLPEGTWFDANGWDYDGLAAGD
jgi:outer membrane protein assembly factor BamE (lipoprotein component of BamABCDE complex)